VVVERKRGFYNLGCVGRRNVQVRTVIRGGLQKILIRPTLSPVVDRTGRGKKKKVLPSEEGKRAHKTDLNYRTECREVLLVTDGRSWAGEKGVLEKGEQGGRRPRQC